MTNAEKFEDVFGFKPNDDAECVAPIEICYANDNICASQDRECPYWMWWDKEYEQPDRLPFE